jgi:hypothetical protein
MIQHLKSSSWVKKYILYLPVLEMMGIALIKKSNIKINFDKDVIRIYIKGCHNERVGKGFLFPDLDIAANNVRRAFEKNQLDLGKLKENFGDGLYEIYGWSSEKEVDSITLEGFSRGAVTTFATAKKLDDLDIPMHIIANQPVPGETGIAKLLYWKYFDLRGCKNIRSAHTFLGSYNLEQGFLHNYFFRQMVAKFKSDIEAQEILFPHQNHLQSSGNSLIQRHIKKLMIQNDLLETNGNQLKKNLLLTADQDIKKWYEINHKKVCFTPPEFMQTIYGAEGLISKDPVFLDIAMDLAKKYCSDSVDTSEQALAIIAIERLFAEDENVGGVTKKDLYQWILKNDKQAKQFITIVNKVTEICDYLPHVITETSASDKNKKLQEHGVDYKKEVFRLSYQFLCQDNPSIKNKNDFAQNIYRAESKFRKAALGIDRNMMRSILKLLTNFITHITGLALIINTANKMQTGNWLLFEHNRSENAVRDARKTLLSHWDKLDTDSEQDEVHHAPPKTRP